MLTLSSQPLAVTRAALRHVAFMREIDPKLDDPAYVRKLYQEGAAPTKPKLKSWYRHLDFGLFDESAAFFGSWNRAQIERYSRSNLYDRSNDDISELFQLL